MTLNIGMSTSISIDKRIDTRVTLSAKAKKVLYTIAATILAVFSYAVSGFIALYLALPGLANANSWTQPQVIQEQIISFLEYELGAANIDLSDVEIQPHKISKTIKLPECSAPLSFNKEGKSRDFYGRNTIKVSCVQPKWSIYSGATIKAYGEVVTAAMPIARGEILTNNHIQMTRIDRSKIHGNALTKPELVVGMAAKRPIRQGKLLSKSQFEQPKLISRGDGIIIKAIGKSMTVSTAGLAMSHGRLGENIRVKNLKSNREVIGQVKNKDTVVVMLY